MIRRLVPFVRDRRGGVTILTAGSLLALLASTALAVDMGSVYVAKRRLQGTADAAALAAVDLPSDQNGAARRTIADNGLASASLASLAAGAYTPDASLAPAQRFAAGAAPANAAQVALVQDVPLTFGSILTGHGSARIQAKATAARIDYAAFSIGSRLAAVQGGLPNALLSGLTGTSLNLSVMDYNALVGANIDLLSFSKALGTQLHLTGASFGETLAANATMPQALSALAAVTGDPTAAAALRKLALEVPRTTIRLSDLIDLGPYASQDHADPDTAIAVDGYSVLREMLALGGGQRQVALDLGLALPGVTSTRLTLAVGQRPAHSPWLTVARDDSVVVRTAQSRLYLDSQIGGAATLGLLSLRLPIYIELAQAQAKLAAISCAGRIGASVTLSVQPSVGTIAIADIDMNSFNDFATPATENRALIAHALLANVTGKSDITLGGVTWQPVSFSASDIAAGTVRTVSTNDIMQGVAGALVGKMNLQASLLGLGLNASALTATVGAALTPVAPTLDGLIDQVTGLLGVRVGQADVRIDGVRCGKPTLVG